VSELRYAAAGRIGTAAIAALMTGVRFETENEPEHGLRQRGEPLLGLCWHGHLLVFAYHHRHAGLATLISQSRDGEYIARVTERWGYTVVRGSSSRGGSSALRDMVRLLRAGHSLAVTPDGPRGPRRRLKPGALLAARLSGVPVLPTAAAATHAWWLGGWDRFLVPKPLARVRLVYGEARMIPRDADDAMLAAIGQEIEDELNELTVRAERALGVHA
jgi:lysophospholipid acyltransferase (LPLAT)-like uncharacterized protein